MTDRNQARVLRRINTDIKKATQSTDYKTYIVEHKKSQFYILYLVFTIGDNIPDYEGQTHIIKIKFCYGEYKDYPKNPPLVRFKSNIWHPNISPSSSDGSSICLTILKNGGSEGWSPMMDVNTIFNSLILLLQEPNDSSPLNGTAASQHRKKDGSFKKASMEYYEKNKKSFDKLMTKLEKTNITVE